MSTYVSPCCAAPCEVVVAGGYFDTSMASRYYACSKCGQPCDPVKGEE